MFPKILNYIHNTVYSIPVYHAFNDTIDYVRVSDTLVAMLC